jgi:CPA2 family monovalent cation:H+ antiporter-2
LLVDGSPGPTVGSVTTTLAAAGADVAQAYLELGAALLVLAVGARLGARLEVPPIAFYLIGGLALGALSPPALTAGFVGLIANLGVVLLLFMLGLEYTAEELRQSLRAHAPAGLVDGLLNFTPGLAAGLALGWGPLSAALLGGITWVSSSGIVAKALADLGRTRDPETPVVLSILVTEDLAMVVYLPVIGALLVGSGVYSAAASLAAAAAAAAVTLLVALRHGHRVARLVGHYSEEAVLLSGLGLVLIVAAFAERLGMSAAVGAFLLGVALSGEVADLTRILLSPLRDLAAALFFLFFGLSIDTGSLPAVLLPALGLAVVTAATKIATGWWAGLRAGLDRDARLRAGTALVPRGEVSIVIGGLGVGAGLHAELGPLTAAYVLVLALAGPLLMKYAGTRTAER